MQWQSHLPLTKLACILTRDIGGFWHVPFSTCQAVIVITPPAYVYALLHKWCGETTYRHPCWLNPVHLQPPLTIRSTWQWSDSPFFSIHAFSRYPLWADLSHSSVWFDGQKLFSSYSRLHDEVYAAFDCSLLPKNEGDHVPVPSAFILQQLHSRALWSKSKKDVPQAVKCIDQ